MNTQNNIKGIKDTISEIFEINKLPETQQEEVLGRIGGIIFQSVLIRVLPVLTKNDLDQYEKMMEENQTIEDIFNFFLEKVPNFLQIIEEESLNFKKESAEVLAQIK